MTQSRREQIQKKTEILPKVEEGIQILKDSNQESSRALTQIKQSASNARIPIELPDGHTWEGGLWKQPYVLMDHLVEWSQQLAGIDAAMGQLIERIMQRDPNEMLKGIYLTQAAINQSGTYTRLMNAILTHKQFKSSGNPISQWMNGLIVGAQTEMRYRREGFTALIHGQNRSLAFAEGTPLGDGLNEATYFLDLAAAGQIRAIDALTRVDKADQTVQKAIAAITDNANNITEAYSLYVALGDLPEAKLRYNANFAQDNAATAIRRIQQKIQQQDLEGAVKNEMLRQGSLISIGDGTADGRIAQKSLANLLQTISMVSTGYAALEIGTALRISTALTDLYTSALMTSNIQQINVKYEKDLQDVNEYRATMLDGITDYTDQMLAASDEVARQLNEGQ